MADGGDPGSWPGLDARLAGYLLANRDFMAPAVDAAVASLELPPGAKALDVGAGPHRRDRRPTWVLVSGRRP